VEYGDPDGLVVVNHHGGLLSATDVAPLDAFARDAGVRLVSFDRPGIAGSTPLPGRTTADGATDAEAVLDHLGVARAAALGWSMGGQYALATAAVLGARIGAVAVVAGCLPLDDPATLAELNAMDRRFTALASHHRTALADVAELWGGLARFSPSAWARVASEGEVDVDVAAVRANADQLASSAHDMAEQRDGVVEEYLAWARPWGFVLGDVACPVRLWQGSADHLVPASWADRLAAGLPSAQLRRLEGEGHFLMLNHGEQVLADLAATVSGSA
jgi:pimeloyl-ACP methyl ester carboxylesterase